MAIDGGAQGVVVPYVEKIEDVKALVGAVRYRPIKGEILDNILSGRTKPNEKLQSFWKRFNQHNYLIIGIESVPAIRRLEELVSIEGVDGVAHPTPVLYRGDGRTGRDYRRRGDRVIHRGEQGSGRPGGPVL